MNGRQAAREAAKRIEILEHANNLYKIETVAYNELILAMIAGKSPCEMCRESQLGECPNSEKQDHGCSEWWLMKIPAEPEKEAADAGEGILPAGAESGN